MLPTHRAPAFLSAVNAVRVRDECHAALAASGAWTPEPFSSPVFAHTLSGVDKWSDELFDLARRPRLQRLAAKLLCMPAVCLRAVFASGAPAQRRWYRDRSFHRRHFTGVPSLTFALALAGPPGGAGIEIRSAARRPRALRLAPGDLVALDSDTYYRLAPAKRTASTPEFFLVAYRGSPYGSPAAR